MAVIFTPEKHEYLSIDEEPINWISGTKLVSKFKQPFDSNQAEKSSKNKKSKWFGMNPETIKEIWKAEGDRSIELGNFYHDQRETDLCSLETMEIREFELPIIKPLFIEGIKHAPNQILTPGIYPEHLVMLKSAGIIGQSDRVDVFPDDYVDIHDYKTGKEIKTKGYTNWEGKVSKMLSPIAHLDDCNFNHYSIQLSLYMYIILRHNPKLKPGKMFIHHILFEEAGRDPYDYPIYARDSYGNPIVKEVIQMPVPYLKDEIKAILNYIKK